MTTPFRTIFEVWLLIWEQIPGIINFWTVGIFNYTLDFLESTALWQWLTSIVKLPDLTIPVDISLMDLFIGGGLGFVMTLIVVIKILELLDLILFFT